MGRESIVGLIPQTAPMEAVIRVRMIPDGIICNTAAQLAAATPHVLLRTAFT
jgi:hypothetical protein